MLMHREVNLKNKCVVEGCTRSIKVKIHKLCNAHYMQFLRKGSPMPGKIKTRKRREPYNPDGNHEIKKPKK